MTLIDDITFILYILNITDIKSSIILYKGGTTLATSSIFANFNITDPKKAESFIKALEDSANALANQKTPREHHYEDFLVHSEDILNFLGKGKNK